MHSPRSRLGLVLGFGTGLGLVLACGGEPANQDCTPGGQGCECVAEQCFSGLTCLSGVCVALPGGTGVGEDTDGPSDDTMGMADATAGLDDTGDSGGSGGTEQDGPIFLTFSASRTDLDDTQQTTITAVLTDPQGVDDIVGGALIDPASGTAYGAFATAASEGSYEFTLSWGTLNAVEPVHGPIEGFERTVRAEFFDQDGHRAWQDVTLTLRCKYYENLAPCDGDCLNVVIDVDNCGACDHQCAPQPWAVSFDCAEHQCTYDLQWFVAQTCDSACAVQSYDCLWGSTVYYSDGSTLPGTCDVAPPPTNGAGTFESMFCVCVPPL